MMYYNEDEARSLTVQAGRWLLDAGLTAGTWGNISARISEDRFIITPSGLPYETLRPEQLVLMDLDGHVYGGGRPSGEKGIHADAYRLHPQIQFVIHTHQENASAVSVLGRDLVSPALPGWRAPCAAYALPSTERLRRAAAVREAQWPECPILLLSRHGTLCMGSCMEEAFDMAQMLEGVCGEYIRERVPPLPEYTVPDLGSSERRGDAFLLTRKGQTKVFAVNAKKHPAAAALHAAVYRSSGVQYIIHEASAETVWASGKGRSLRPMLDDLAQIAGPDIRCAELSPERVRLALRDRDAVFLRGAGAFCAGTAKADAEAVQLILRKGCKAQRLAETVPGCRPLGRADAAVQRALYVKNYAKRKLKR